MPISAAELFAGRQENYLRLLIMGGPKVGKTVSAVTTSPAPRYVICCDARDTCLRGAFRRTKDFDVDMVRVASGSGPTANHHAWSDMLIALKNARDGTVKEKKYKTIILDTLSEFAANLEEECAHATMNHKGEPDGRRYWSVYEKRLRHVINNLFSLPAHIIVVTHYLEVGAREGIADEKTGEKGTPKRGEGIVPLLGGKARGTIPALFDDVVWMDFRRDQRVFVTGPQGVWGPGCRSTDETVEIDADIGELIKLFKDGSASLKKPAPPAKPNPPRIISSTVRPLPMKPQARR
jgi:AAA domain